ncbi:Aste57867_14287 [Aphanomyces stellatus]|uniref:subtilisin n=1 Tax=Aphanomyces stellatus TaxID=120398 RepID=A0A485L2Q6_9STRA|nr:hypothetical protein As57867_014235 [Aphanomyces stellatus]VFT91112.1 Aste57867_14287 [Aphanomyces stellatus]
MQLAFFSLALAASHAAKFSLQLNRAFELQTLQEIDVLVKFNVDSRELNAIAAHETEPSKRRQAVHDYLVQANADAEAHVRAIVGQEKSISAIWIANAFLVRVDLATASAIADLAAVSYLDVNADVQLVDYLTKDLQDDDVPTPNVEWGVQAVGAPSIWEFTKGQGAVVASIDTGALVSHEAIQANWRAEKGWFDPYDKKPTPYDSQGHGSHTIGTSVGANGIGVAPDALWISCLGLKGGSGSTDKLLACAQWVICPTDPDGTNPDCDAGADVVNNSWGAATSVYNPFFEGVVAAWRAANIVPVFSNGNSGPRCASTGQPGSYTSVISVGAIGSDKSDPTTLAYFSSKGPATVADPSTNATVTIVKPDVSAPGYWTRSVGITNDTAYVLNAGTSMAAPHVAGVVALLKSFDKTLTYDQVYQYLTQTTDQDLLNTTEPAKWIGGQPGGINCGGVDDASWPNNRFGHGQVNVGTILRDGSLHDSRDD